MIFSVVFSIALFVGLGSIASAVVFSYLFCPEIFFTFTIEAAFSQSHILIAESLKKSFVLISVFGLLRLHHIPIPSLLFQILLPVRLEQMTTE